MAGITNGQAQAATNGHTTHNIAPKITLYTNHGCPWAHRAHIALAELNLPFEEVIIDLNTPRPQWYLDINPRGLVPTIKYSVPGIMDEEIIYESGIVAQFLCDSFPSHLLPASKESPTSALTRARMTFFADTWFTKTAPLYMAILRASEHEKDAKVDEWIAAFEKEIEPLLKDASPFFGGSKQLTFAEVLTAPFVVRALDMSKDGEVVPRSATEKLSRLPNLSKWMNAVAYNESVLKIYDSERVIAHAKRKAASKV
ncbi:hypothetical protein BAUCODRAFT_187903 [Baudoinia panamericana UAMH 10762]|uniref:GST N-terminal domain-containing protein n=1 Tax=Baudoinia panamericana (strain UAMH 10762) TaxID=717646 RepID=M2M1F2_BAUPA|nr:uncharacterized protein BAUCODRAFT_187903 [Baudoinia panamericana UAMH 10762]EMD00878.1 hypothetical protein BAUCODRAFT_187903 [Baudoinia panamericana UAMH 10762]